MPQEEAFSLTLESKDLPADRLHVRRVTGTEALSRLFDFEIEVVCLDHDGPGPEAMTGARVTLVMERFAGPAGGWSGTRRLSGIVVEVEDMLSTHTGFRVYRLRLAPRAFALTMVETQDIFMGLSVPRIIEQKLQAVNLTGASALRLTGAYPPREFVVQYKESDYAFVCRLAEHLGISFFFEQGEAGETIVFADDASAFVPVEGAEKVAYRARGEEREVFALTVKRRVVPAYYAVRDYNYRTPSVDITGESELPGAFAGGVIEYGAHHKTPDEGKALAAVRADERRAGEVVFTGQSTVAAIAAGARVTVTDHPDLGAVDLLVTEVTHHAVQAVAGAKAPEEPGYRNTFRAIPGDRMFRPARATPRPRIAGLVTGIVDPGPAGPSAKYAQIDEQGRYLVRFLFDTTPPGERPASRPVRMLQNHAGEGYGTHFPLKPGVEVAVGFIDGDPDRPVIVGAVPNPIKPSPVTGANAGVHRIKTSTGIRVDMAE